jgi:hypothetical protein
LLIRMVLQLVYEVYPRHGKRQLAEFLWNTMPANILNSGRPLAFLENTPHDTGRVDDWVLR